MAADYSTILSRITETLNAVAPGGFSATIDSAYLDRNASAIAQAANEGAQMIARAICSNPRHIHRNIFVQRFPTPLTHGGFLPDMAGEYDLIETQAVPTATIITAAQALDVSSSGYRRGVPRTVQQIESFRENVSSIYSTLAHTSVNRSPLAHYYAIHNGRIYFTGTNARGYFPKINRGVTTGVKQVQTLTVGGSGAGLGTARFLFTSAYLQGSPVTVETTTNIGTASVLATLWAAELALHPEVSALWDITTNSANIIFTLKSAAANDTTMAITLTDVHTSGYGNATAAATTAGVAPGVTTLIPDEYEDVWVALGVGMTVKEGDNLMPVAQYYYGHGMAGLQQIAAMEHTSPLPAPERAINARNDV